jgi:hypothetical protein
MSQSYAGNYTDEFYDAAGLMDILAISPVGTALSSSSIVTSPLTTIVDSSGPIISQPFPTLATESNGTIFTTPTEPGTVPSLNPNIDVNPQILEALENKERRYVLNLGEKFEALINDGR